MASELGIYPAQLLLGWHGSGRTLTVLKFKYMIRMIKNLYGYVSCKYCGRDCGSTGSGMSINGMCERCYENGGDEE